MKTKTITIISIILAVCMLIAVSIPIAYAYFKSIKDLPDAQRPSFGLDELGNKTISIADETALFINSQDNIYNNNNIISDPTKARFTLKLTNNITLNNDLFVTADCHIDLGGFTIFLNGHTITIMHGYAGSFVITNGSFTPTSLTDKLYIDTPNAVVITDVAFKSGTTVYNNADYIVVKAVDNNLVAYNIFYEISNILSNGKQANVSRFDYGDIKSYFDKDTNGDGIKDNLDFSKVTFGNAKHSSCSFCQANQPHHCYYVSQNVDLPLYYYCYKVEIKYTSDNNGVIDSFGRVSPKQNAVTNVAFTATLNYEGNSLSFASKTFDLHIVHNADDANKVKVANTLLLDYLEKYYIERDNDNNGSIDWTGYSFSGELNIPKTDLFSGAIYGYQTYDGSAQPTLLDDTANITSGITSVGHFRESSTNMYNFVINQNIKRIKFSVKCNGATATSPLLNVEGNVSQSVQDNYTVAQGISSAWYGGKIQITNANSGDPNALNGYTTKPLFKDVSAYADKNVTSVTYELVNNIDDVYNIDDVTPNQRLHVKLGRNPNNLQSVFLKMTFAFSLGTNLVDISIPIEYVSNSEDGNTQIHPFLPYYTYFNRVADSLAGKVTTNSFEMPLSYPTGSPIICFDITGDLNNAITLQLYYDGVAHTLLLGGHISYVEAFDAYLASANLTLEQLLKKADKKWIININTDLIGKTDNLIELKYNYKFGVQTANGHIYPTTLLWEKYSATTTFTLPGILRAVLKDGSIDSLGMPDLNLYKWTYDNFTIYNDKYSFTSDKNVKFIRTSWLMVDKPFNNTKNILNIENYQGIEYLKGSKVVRLSEALTNLTMDKNLTILEHLSGMASLEELYLDNNALYDSLPAPLPPSTTQSGTNGLPETADNKLLAKLVTLTKLKLLDISNNKIYRFNDLERIPSLEIIYIYNNTHKSNVIIKNTDGTLADKQYTDAINTYFTNVANSLYGSVGATNMSTFMKLYSVNGTKIYNINATSPYTGVKSTSGYDGMFDIEYQDRLASGIDIGNIYNMFSTNYLDYNITFPNAGEGYTDIANHPPTIKFAPVGDKLTATSFTMTLTFTVKQPYMNQLPGGGQERLFILYDITVVATFEVTRI
ncbi:MAG: hypothetical protein RR248_02050 [Clostridia bacterium]